MPKKLFAIHGMAKGKRAFDVHPAVHVWADSPEEANVRGRQIIAMNPIYNQHFGEGIQVKEKD